MRYFLVLFASLLVGCGGGGSSGSDTEPPAALTIPAGLYSTTLQGSELGELMQGTDGSAVYATKARMAYGTWTYTSTSASISLTSLSHPIDDLGNEFPAAKSASRTDQFSVSQSGSNWSGAGIVLTPIDRGSAPAIASMPRNWRFSNLYRFGSEFLDYTLQIDIDSAGTLSGFDTNGCRFTGSLTALSTAVSVYAVEVFASQCGATSRYIDNANYDGYAYITEGMPTALTIQAVNAATAIGLSLRLTAR